MSKPTFAVLCLLMVCGPVVGQGWTRSQKQDEIQTFYQTEKTGANVFDVRIKVDNRRPKAVKVVLAVEQETSRYIMPGGTYPILGTRGRCEMVVPSNATRICDPITVNARRITGVKIIDWKNVDDCPHTPLVATLNFFPITFRDATNECQIFPPLSLTLTEGGWPRNEAEWNSGVTAKAGDEILVRIYIDNSAANNSPAEQAVAKNVTVTTSVSREIGTEHTVAASFKGDNTNTVAKAVPVRTGANERLEVIQNSGELFDAKGQLIRNNFSLGNNLYRIGDLYPGFETDLFLFFKIKVSTNRK